MNTLTAQNYRDMADAIEAKDAGKPIQWRRLNEPDWWIDQGTEDGLGLFGRVLYRPKPEPVLRDWSKPEDVPGSVCWLRPLSNTDIHFQIVGMDKSGFNVSTQGSREWSQIADYEHSADRLTWKACQTTA